MATAELHPVGSEADGATADRRATLRASRAAGLLGFALLATLAYAAFAHGASRDPYEAHVQFALAVIAVVAASAALYDGGLRTAAPRAAGLATGLMALFALWCGLSLAWTVAPTESWLWANRAIAYALAIGLGVLFGASHPRALARAGLGLACVTGAVAAYALGQKVIPGVDLGVVSFDRTGAVSRLRAPLDYWNALGLMCAFGLPLALVVAVDSTRTRRVRIAGAVGLLGLVVVLALTYSRGSVLAGIVALAVTLGVAGSRLRSLAVLAIALAASAAPLAVAFARDDLTDSGVVLAERIDDGLLLGAVLLGAVGLLAGAMAAFIARERRTPPDPVRSRRIGRALVAALAVGVVAAAIPVAAADPWGKFTTTQDDAISDPSRLTSPYAGNRWVWWKEAAGAWSDRPLEGWGAGSFGVTHLRYRQDELSVRQPHSVPLQLGAETGVVGLLFGGGSVLVLLLAARDGVRRASRGRERALAGALLAAGVAWAVHGLVDWDWDIPGVTLPALVALAIVAGSGRSAAPRAASRRPMVARTVLVLATALAGVAYAVSVALPSLAASRTESALVNTSIEDAERAADLNPVSSAPLLAAAALAERDGRLDDARELVLDGLRRDPDAGPAWAELVRIEFVRGDLPGTRRALARALALDPRSPRLRALASRLATLEAPAARSATATGTPLPPRP